MVLLIRIPANLRIFGPIIMVFRRVEVGSFTVLALCSKSAYLGPADSGPKKSWTI